MPRLTAILALAILAAACSGDAAADYVADLEEIGRSQRIAAAQIVPGTAGDTAAPPTLSQLRALTELRRGAQDAVLALEPPAPLATRHARFSATLATVVLTATKGTAKILPFRIAWMREEANPTMAAEDHALI